MTGGPSIAFTRKAVANDMLIRKTNIFCKSIVGIDVLFLSKSLSLKKKERRKLIDS